MPLKILQRKFGQLWTIHEDNETDKFANTYKEKTKTAWNRQGEISFCNQM